SLLCVLRTGGTARSPACQTKELPWPRPSALPGTVSLRRTHIIRCTAHQCNRPVWVFWAYRSSTCTVNRCTGMPPLAPERYQGRILEGFGARLGGGRYWGRGCASHGGIRLVGLRTQGTNGVLYGGNQYGVRALGCGQCVRQLLGQVFVGGAARSKRGNQRFFACNAAVDGCL